MVLSLSKCLNFVIESKFAQVNDSISSVSKGSCQFPNTSVDIWFLVVTSKCSFIVFFIYFFVIIIVNLCFYSAFKNAKLSDFFFLTQGSRLVWWQSKPTAGRRIPDFVSLVLKVQLFERYNKINSKLNKVSLQNTLVLVTMIVANCCACTLVCITHS